MTVAARPGSAADPARFSVLLAGALLAGCVTFNGDALGAEQPAAPSTFDQYEVDARLAQRQTVLTGFLLGGAVAELAVVYIDENEDRRLRIYAFDGGTWVPRLDATLGPGVSFVDVATIAGRDRLVTYDCGRLNWFDPDSATERALVVVSSNFNPPRRGEIPRVDVARDVNGDDRDDLVVPDVDGFWVFIQMRDGAFSDPVKLGPATEMNRIYGADGYRYDPWSQSRVHEVDYNHDGRGDLVFWNDDHFEVHTQDERGLFAPTGTTFTTDVGFHSDELSTLATGDMLGTVLHSLTDLNGDSVADLVVVSLEGRSISGKRSTYEVHFGAQQHPMAALCSGGASTSRVLPQGSGPLSRRSQRHPQNRVGRRAQPSRAWLGATRSSRTTRSSSGWDRHDFDRDGQIDLMFTTIEVEFLGSSLWKRLKGFMGDDVWLDLEFYHRAAGRYPRRSQRHPQNRVGRRAQPSRAWLGATGHRASRRDARTPMDPRRLPARVQQDVAHRGCDRRRPLG